LPIMKRLVQIREASQTVFGPNRAHLLIGRKLATSRGAFRGGDRILLFGCERDWRFVIGAGQTKDDRGDVVLSVRRKAARGSNRLIEKLCHSGASKITAIGL
jgi:hypothetical protein